MSWFNDFKIFLLRGNVVDTAIGVIIGIVFGNVVNSLVNDIIMPPLGFILSGIDFSKLSLTFSLPAATSPIEIRYGVFLNVLLNFVVVSWVVFFVVKMMTRLRLANEDKLAPPRYCPACLMAIPLRATKCGHCCSDLSLATPRASGPLSKERKNSPCNDEKSP